jgi:hypothetical protein
MRRVFVVQASPGAALLAAAVAIGCGKGANDGHAAMPTAATGSGAGGGSTTSSGSTGVGGAIIGPMGDPGCGLSAAAFCDNFNSPSSPLGRAGELDKHRWSAGRLEPQLPSASGFAIGIGPGDIPATCRSGIKTSVFPDEDTLVCDPSSDIMSNHLLVATAAQNYGQNSYRIRQPFDFTGRTGKIVFNGEGYIKSSLLGWISLEVTEDPLNAPSFAIGGDGTRNDEGSLVPRNALEVEFQDPCESRTQTPSVSIRMINVIKNYVQTPLMAPNSPCVGTQQGKLNHFEVTVAKDKIEVYATPFSADGVHFGAPVLLQSANVDLPFTHGYVQISVHNHATRKYSDNHALTAWVARWDDVGFDGPIASNWREYEVPDSLKPGTGGDGPVVNVGYPIADASKGPSSTFHLSGVDVTGVTSARISASTWYLADDHALVPTYVLRYRFNGNPWRDRPLNTGEVGQLTGSNSQYQIGQIIDVMPSDLVSGDNTLEFVTVNVPQNYPPLIANVDLVLTTN